MNRKVTVAAFAVVALLIAVLAGRSILSQKTQAPNVAVPTLDGRTLTLGELRGKVVLVNFWATTCTTCVGEMPQMTATYKSFAPRGYEMIAVAMEYDRPDWVANFAQKNALPFTVALDPKGDAAHAFGGVMLTPTTFLIDKQGRIVQKFLGAPDFTKLNATIDQLLKAT